MDMPVQAGSDFGAGFLVQISDQISLHFSIQPCVQSRDMSSIGDRTRGGFDSLPHSGQEGMRVIDSGFKKNKN